MIAHRTPLSPSTMDESRTVKIWTVVMAGRQVDLIISPKGYGWVRVKGF